MGSVKVQASITFYYRLSLKGVPWNPWNPPRSATGMGSLVISTILKTRSLHNVHNVLIVNLMVSDIVGLIVYTFQTTGMMLSYIIGIQDPFRCDIFNFFLFPDILSMHTLVILWVEKFRVCQVIVSGWITAVLFRFTRLVYRTGSFFTGLIFHEWWFFLTFAILFSRTRYLTDCFKCSNVTFAQLFMIIFSRNATFFASRE